MGLNMRNTGLESLPSKIFDKHPAVYFFVMVNSNIESLDPALFDNNPNLRYVAAVSYTHLTLPTIYSV